MAGAAPAEVLVRLPAAAFVLELEPQQVLSSREL